MSQLQLQCRKMTVRSRRFHRGALELAKMNIIEMTSRHVLVGGALVVAKIVLFCTFEVIRFFWLKVHTLISGIFKVELMRIPKRS